MRIDNWLNKECLRMGGKLVKLLLKGIAQFPSFLYNRKLTKKIVDIQGGIDLYSYVNEELQQEAVQSFENYFTVL